MAAQLLDVEQELDVLLAQDRVEHGQRLLAEECLRIGADTVAVGSVFEVDDVADFGTYDIVVLEPFEPRDDFRLLGGDEDSPPC